jgi:putative aldouronate transport system substrate-binding protein
MPEAIWKNSMVQGKAYGVPRPRGLYGGGEASFLLRKDWLDKLNLKVPTTLDEMTQVLRAFRDNDPAGGGKTIPMVAFARDEHVFGATSAIFYPFGVPNYYTIENGTPKYLIQTEGYKRYLEWLRMAYAEKLIDKDAPILKQQQAREKFYAGIAGAFVFHVGGLNDANYDLLRKSAPGAELVVVPPLEGPAGRRASVESGYFGLWVIPSSVPKAKVEKIVEFLNFSASEENFIFSKTGVIGVHSSEFKNGIAVQTEEQRKKMTADVPSAFVLENRYDPYNYAGSSDPEINKYQKEMLDMLEKVEGVPNPFSSYNSTTAAQNPDHLKSFSAVALKYVVGEVGWDAVQNEIDKWEKTYGTKILNEMMEQYKRDQQ